MRVSFIVLAVLFLAAAIWLVGFAWPLSQGYQSFLPMVRDKLNRSYERPFDRTILRQDLVSSGFLLGQAAFVRIFKQESRLELWMREAGKSDFSIFRTYEICKFSGLLGPKLAEGDKQSPEGFYQVARSQLNPSSQRHLSFNIGFPNVYDRAQNRTGTYLMVHGGCSSIGCYAMTDEGVDEIYAIVEAALDSGQGEVPVHIFPFKMVEKNLAKYSDHEWADFWQNLKQGYDLFEQYKVPPKAGVCGTKYVFNGDVGSKDCKPVTGWG